VSGKQTPSYTQGASVQHIVAIFIHMSHGSLIFQMEIKNRQPIGDREKA